MQRSIPYEDPARRHAARRRENARVRDEVVQILAASRLPPSSLCSDEVPVKIYENPIPSAETLIDRALLQTLETQNQLLVELIGLISALVTAP